MPCGYRTKVSAYFVYVAGCHLGTLSGPNCCLNFLARVPIGNSQRGGRLILLWLEQYCPLKFSLFGFTQNQLTTILITKMISHHIHWSCPVSSGGNYRRYVNRGLESWGPSYSAYHNCPENKICLYDPTLIAMCIDGHIVRKKCMKDGYKLLLVIDLEEWVFSWFSGNYCFSPKL